MSTIPTSVLEPAGESPPPRFCTLQEWLDWQQRLHFTAIEMELDRCRTVAQRMGLLKPDFTVITVAGTNGKGSSATMLDLILRNAGYSVGKYTSPHLVRYNERICIDGREASAELLCRSFDRIDRARGNISLTFFEFGTLAALDIFRASGIDVAVLEVGLGGRLDAVNILDADVSLVTTIDIDHERWLGFDRESIGREKAGIFRPHRPAICADPSPPRSIVESAARIQSDFYQAGRDFHYECGSAAWNWHSSSGGHGDLPVPGVYNGRQVQNAAGVVMALEVLRDRCPVPVPAIHEGFRQFRLPGRFQIVTREVPYILDVAHNHQSMTTLAENLKRLPCSGRTHMVIGMLKDKNHQAVLETLHGCVDAWYVVDLPDERAVPGARLVELLAQAGYQGRVTAARDVHTGLEAARLAAATGDRIVVTGSFVTVGPALQMLDAG